MLGEDFETLSVAPSAGYIVDEPDSDADDKPEYAFDAWYDYDVQTHTLSASDRTYVIRTTSGMYYRLRMEDYYSDAGTSGHLSFRWGTVSAP
jgi:hypothetical protein